MPDASKTYIVNDQPTDTDALDFTPYVETLADIIQTGNTPLTIGVFGTWGSGKTSLMKMVKKNLPDDFTVAWFDAWKYDKEETLWRAFLLNVLFAVEQKSGETEELKTLKTMLYRGLEFEKTGGVTIDLAKLGAKFAEGAIQIGLSFIPPLATLADMAKELQKSGAGNVAGGFETAIQRERTKIYVEQVRSLEQFQEKFSNLVKSYIAPKRLVVFIDDLDRCLPEKAIEVLEAIKLFLDAEQCVFVLGLDQEVIARGIEMKYKEFGAKQDGDSAQQKFTIEGVRYLEKIIQLPFQIPPVEQNDMGDFVHGLSADWPHEECPKVFSVGLGDNPRQIKRTVNTFLILWKLAEKRKDKLQERVKPIRLAKVVAIQTVYPDLYNLLLKEEPRYLRELEEYYRNESSASKDTDESVYNKRGLLSLDRFVSNQGQTPEPEKVEPPPALVPFLSRRGSVAVKRILTMHKLNLKDANFVNLPPDELRLYFTLTARAEAPGVAPAAEERLIFEPQMVRIPAGKFLMGSTKDQVAQFIKATLDKDWAKQELSQHTVELSEYSIGKYPVTNREYQAFLRDAKYKTPRGWEGDQFPNEKGGHPVVNVSWEDASAYCQWLSAKTGKTYRLPTEAEWEKAARGEDGRIYSWGNEFDPHKANTAESKIGNTSEVGQFSPQGDSPYGCADMIGNVFEWTHSLLKPYPYKANDGKEDEKATDAYVLRGGSFLNNERLARCAFRGVERVDRFDFYIGFRVVVASPDLS
jgi:formylglycine-generating enzyme required for sulfatase activity